MVLSWSLIVNLQVCWPGDTIYPVADDTPMTPPMTPRVAATFTSFEQDQLLGIADTTH